MVGIMVREGRSEDFGAATELLNRVWPYRVGSELSLRHACDAEPPDAHRRYWAAEDDGKVVGWATAAIEDQSAEHPGFLQVSVAPESRNCGLGTALLECCEAHLADLGVTTVHASTTPEEASQRIATARGFRHTNTTRISGVDPRTIEPCRAPPGVDLRPLAGLDPRKVYELDAEAMLDVPGEVAMDEVSFEQWLKDYWREPDTDLDASVAALIGDRPVAFSHLRIAPGGRADDRDAARVPRPRPRPAGKARDPRKRRQTRSRARLHRERRNERTDAPGQRETRLSAHRQHTRVVTALSEAARLGQCSGMTPDGAGNGV
jgi:N-acetylglutamate synthase-like GNAT family acetyltransferase